MHVHEVPARREQVAAWPDWVAPAVYSAFSTSGITTLWSHQREAADYAHDGTHVVISTGTASGKSLGYLLPVLSDVVDGANAPSGRGATALYLSPTKALAADQLARLTALAIPGLRSATYDGDTAPDERRWIRDHSQYVLTNPDLVHHSLLPGHPRWAPFLRALKYVVIDECHVYRGVFGSHLAALLRRLRRVAAHYGAHPTFILASATVADPQSQASALIGMPVRPVILDGSPREAMTFGLWEPGLVAGGGGSGADNAENDRRNAPHRRSAVAETADLLADLVVDGVQTVAFGRSRAGVEAVASSARRSLRKVDPTLGSSVAAYRGGYLPEERRELEKRLRSGALRGLAATNALELGIDVSGLDAVLMAGWPGTCASLWQQAGRAGRNGSASLAVLVAGDDPLDTYLVHHPEALFDRPVEAAVLDPENPYILAPHLAAAAAELPLTPPMRRCSGRPWWACSRCWWLAGCCGDGRAGGSGPDPNEPPTTSRYVAPVRPCASSSGRPDGCWAPSTGRRPIPASTPAPCMCIRASPTSLPTTTSRTPMRSLWPGTRGGPPGHGQ